MEKIKSTLVLECDHCNSTEIYPAGQGVRLTHEQEVSLLKWVQVGTRLAAMTNTVKTYCSVDCAIAGLKSNPPMTELPLQPEPEAKQ